MECYGLQLCTLWWLQFPGLQQPLAGHAKAKTTLLASSMPYVRSNRVERVLLPTLLAPAADHQRGSTLRLHLEEGKETSRTT